MTSRPAALPLPAPLLGPVLAAVLALALTGCSGDGDDGPTAAGPAALPEDLCAEIVPVLPADLGLGDPVAGGAEQPGQRSATCAMSGPGGTGLRVELTSYAVADVDDPVELRVAHLAACNELLTRDGLSDTRQEEFDCVATLPVGSFVSLDLLQAVRAVLRLELVAPDLEPEQVAAYGTAIGAELR